MEQQNLRTLTVGEILDRAFRIYRAKFFPLLGIVALMLIPEGILQFIATLYLGNAQNLSNILNSIFQNLAMLALIVAISNANLGREFTIGSAYSEGTARFWSLFGSNFVIGLAIAAPLFVVGACLATAGGFGFLIIIPFLPLVVFLFTRWSLNAPAIVLEKAGAVDSLYRSWNLTRDFFWRVLGTSFLASLLSLLLTLLPYLFVNFILLEMMGLSSQMVDLTSVVVQQIALVIVLPFTVAVKVLIYYDLRIRKEGFDLMLRAEEASGESQSAA